MFMDGRTAPCHNTTVQNRPIITSWVTKGPTTDNNSQAPPLIQIEEGAFIKPNARFILAIVKPIFCNNWQSF